MSARSTDPNPGTDAARTLVIAGLASLIAACASGGGTPGQGTAQLPHASPRTIAMADEVVPAVALQTFNRALDALARGDVAEAELALKDCVREYPDYPGPYVNLAIIYMDAERTQDARQFLDAALEIDPGHAAANNQLGMLLRAEGHFNEAHSAYLRAIDSNPDYALAYHNLGVLFDVYLRRPVDALENYERYQSLLSEPDETVAGWIIELRRRLTTVSARVN